MEVKFVRQEQLEGKGVVDSEAKVLGYVCGIEFDIKDWGVTHLCVNLTDDAVEILGYKKPRFFGSIVINIPVEVVKAISDVVALDRSAKELRNLVERRP